MSHLLEKHPEEILIALAISMLVLLGACYVWSIQVAAENINRTISISRDQTTDTRFNIDAAKKIDFKGLPPANAPEPSSN